MKLDEIQELVKEESFTIKSHSLPHRLKEGFGVEEIIYAVLTRPR